MDPSELLRIVDTIHRDKNIDKEIVFEGIEAALVSAAKKHFGEDEEIVVQIDRANGVITWKLDDSKENEIRATTGFWAVKPHKDGCLVYYSVALDTGHAVPGWLEDYLTKKDLPSVVTAVKKRVGG